MVRKNQRLFPHFANSFNPSRMSCAVSAPSPAIREAPAMAAAAIASASRSAGENAETAQLIKLGLKELAK